MKHISSRLCEFALSLESYSWFPFGASVAFWHEDVSNFEIFSIHTMDRGKDAKEE